LALALVAGCGEFPSPAADRPSSRALDASTTATTRIGSAVTPLVAAHPGLSGIHALPTVHSAFAARALLAAAAERSLDVQYYIWHDDVSGGLLVEALRLAADRGVRVRLLLDDNNTAGMDPLLAALDAHPNVELRLYNPFVQRQFRPLGYVTEFSRLNRRMHNKSFTADNQATIVGGRNVGDEYFAAGEEVGFADLDVLAVGPVVNEVSKSFDLYWSSASAYPAASVIAKSAGDGHAELARRAQALQKEPRAHSYLDSVAQSPIMRDLASGQLALDWARTTVHYDDPAKTLARRAELEQTLMLPRLAKTVGEARSGFDVVSPYFVPTRSGAEGFAELARRGVKVRVLTNSLAATDVSTVHAGYAKWRPTLLDAGVQLFELQRSAGIGDKDQRLLLTGSSAASLHAKTFAVDGERIFIGSFNLDPRSAALNTELGFVIESPRLANALG